MLDPRQHLTNAHFGRWPCLPMLLFVYTTAVASPTSLRTADRQRRCVVWKELFLTDTVLLNGVCHHEIVVHTTNRSRTSGNFTCFCPIFQQKRSPKVALHPPPLAAACR